ncbi:Bifunctional epoxide hydrolase 2-like protein 5 [Pleurostoma richardsiae]|uniref:Bifunctional epoxide hydrolase 2-like protein 5 n=1 Tax=Pleurostoma richardsiae TaxID=41990 RepID=A0AA38VD99_9PEZI|nr:Bifunctional epoxide hydrolase 2-like protein 5 [Pleurostoma richardsiae]
MTPDKLKPNDPRVQSLKASVRGKTYHYLLGKPADGVPIGTVLLVHGFPDFSFGWRYQVPMFLSMNLQVVVPDMIGYAGTDAPEDLTAYSLKSVSDDMAELVGQICPGEQIILGGHDWGGFFVWRMVHWHPDLVRAVFSVCTPYRPPAKEYIDGETMTKRLPNFRYQLQFAGPDVEREIKGRERTEQFLRGIYGGRGPAGELVMSTAKGILFENLDKLGPSPLVNDEELKFYVDAFAPRGLRGPLNWYRTREINYQEEQALFGEDGKASKVNAPSLLILAENDKALPPAMANGMEKFFDDLTKKQVDAHHWALWEAAEEVNAIIREFLGKVLQPATVKASI